MITGRDEDACVPDECFVAHDLRHSRRTGRYRSGACSLIRTLETLEASPHVQRDRVAVCDRAAAPARDEGRRLAHERTVDGLQAPRHGAGALATPRRRAPPAARPRGCRLRGRRAAGEQARQASSRRFAPSTECSGSRWVRGRCSRDTKGRHGAMPLKPDPRRQCFWFSPTSSSRCDRNSLRIGEVFDLL